jgi:hypothetical protein
LATTTGSTSFKALCGKLIATEQECRLSNGFPTQLADRARSHVARRPIGNTMSKSLFVRIAASMLLWTVSSVSAQQLGTAEQARAMLDRAISALKSNEATALSEFNDPNNKQFHERDLYVFCYDMSDGKITAYESPALLNIDVRTLALKDDPIGQRTYEAAQNAPEESIVTIEYKLPKPGTTEPAPKQTVEMRIGHQSCGVTYYK